METFKKKKEKKDKTILRKMDKKSELLEYLIKVSNFQPKIIRHAKKEENVTPNQEKKKKAKNLTLSEPRCWI